MALVKEKGSYFFKYPKDLKKEGVDYSFVVKNNKEGMTILGQQKIIDFFTTGKDLPRKIKYRKLLSFILLQHNLYGKDIVLTDEMLCRFSGIPRKELLHALFYLYRRFHLIKGRNHTYRLPEYLWNTDILNKVKKLQK